MTKSQFDFDGHIDALEESTMFYMSLGSKELFHTNFLHWLSIVDRTYFINILKRLASTTTDPVSFWWEEKFKNDVNGEIFEVRREDKNFDLSIWLLTNKEKQDKEIWIPVLIIENKMKSLPYREQLEKYVDKAFDFWKKGEEIKAVIKEKKKKEKQSNNEWNWNAEEEGRKITFIVLSLLTPANKETLGERITEKVSYKKGGEDCSIDFSFNWICKNYNDLYNVLDQGNKEKSFCEGKKFFQQILTDYQKFIKSLYDIANNDWKINPKDEYLTKICPNSLDDDKDEKDEKEKIVQLEKLRIADIREKICYDQLLNELVNKLESEKIKVQKTEKIEKRNFSCRTAYYHKIGLFEVYFMIDNIDGVPFYLTIQIQGQRYTHAISGKNVVKVKDKKNILGDFWTNGKGKCWKDKISFFFNFSEKEENIFPEGLKTEKTKNIYRYGSNFIYQCADIPSGMSIEKVLNCVVEDVKKIMSQSKEQDWIKE